MSPLAAHPAILALGAIVGFASSISLARMSVRSRRLADEGYAPPWQPKLNLATAYVAFAWFVACSVALTYQLLIGG